MIRTNIFLSEPQKEKLEKQAKKLGISMAELIRRVLDEYLKRQK